MYIEGRKNVKGGYKVGERVREVAANILAVMLLAHLVIAIPAALMLIVLEKE